MKKTKIFESKINEGIKDNIKNIIANKGYGEVLASIDKSINDFKHSGYTFLEISDVLNQFYNIGDSKINDYIKSKGYNIKDVVNEDGNKGQFEQKAKYLPEDWQKWKSEIKNKKDFEIVADGTLELVYINNKHIGTYYTEDGIIMTDNLSMFGNPVNESSDDDFTPQQIADIITNTNSKMVEVTVDQLTPQMVEKFNTGFGTITAKYPDYDPYNDDFDGEDYQMNLQLSDSIVNDIADNMIFDLPIFEGAEDKSKKINEDDNINTIIPNNTTVYFKDKQWFSESQYAKEGLIKGYTEYNNTYKIKTAYGYCNLNPDRFTTSL